MDLGKRRHEGNGEERVSFQSGTYADLPNR
jgi:hypothetical protein